MNYTQNERIEQVTDTTLVIGVDIGSRTHYARAFDKNYVSEHHMKLPKDIVALGVGGIRKIWHDKKMRGRGVNEDRANEEDENSARYCIR